MKIFNVENNENKIYVQLQDLFMLNRNDKNLPESIYSKRFIKIDKFNNKSFIEFNDSKAIEFFKEVDWIIDYREFRCLSEIEIRKKIEIIELEQNDIMKIINLELDDDNLENLTKKYHLMKKYELLDYKKKCIIEILKLKTGKNSISFPLVPDYDGFIYVEKEAPYYEAILSIEFNKLLVYRTDGKLLSENEQISEIFIEKCIHILESIVMLNEYKVLNYNSPDDRYLVIEIKPNYKKTKKCLKKCLKRKK